MRKFLVLVTGLILATGAYVVWSINQPKDLIVQGEVEATRVDLSAQVTARIRATPVDFGDRIDAGQTVVELTSPQLIAALSSAKAALAVAQANKDLVFSTRPETIAARQAQFDKALSDLELARKTQERILRLRNSKVTSDQALDKANNALDAAIKAKEAAEAQLALAKNGSSKEQKAVAIAQVEQAIAAVKRIEADVEELHVTAPFAGQITARMAEKGKLFSAGSPLISLVDVDHSWFTFNLREDLLNGLKVGAVLHVRVPALGDKMIDARVSAINAEGTYANWRATKATGNFDLRTFSIRVEPLVQDADLRPGMSALIDLAA